MAFIPLPKSRPYSDPYVAFGPQMCPPAKQRAAFFFFDWSTVTTESPGIYVNYGQRPDMPEQISCLYIDNSRCHQGVTIVFPDTGFRYVLKPFKRAYIPVQTAGTDFYVTIPVPDDGASDSTIIYALNYVLPPVESDVFIYESHFSIAFDPATDMALPDIVNAVDGEWRRLRRFSVVIANMTADSAGFSATFTLFRDGQVYATAPVVLFAGGFLDTATIIQLDNEGESAAQSWTYQWTVLAGALTGAGTAFLNILLDDMDQLA